MTCCGGDIAADNAVTSAQAAEFAKAEALIHAGSARQDGTVQYVFSVPDVHCGTCISSIERAMADMHGVRHARVNLTLKRVTVHLEPDEVQPSDVVRALETLGFPAQPVDLGDLEELETKRKDGELLRSLAVAGFASSNIMLLSVSVWSGAEGATRDLFHLISGVIAVPAVIYSGRVFFRSAFGALRHGRVNMDVPITLAIMLATSMSIFESLTGGHHAYFEASTMLLFFLLIGRYLDQRMRERARNAVVQLSRLSAKGANAIMPDGTLQYMPLDEIDPGMTIRVLPGERVPLDGILTKGRSDVDRSLITGESAPVAVSDGQTLESGAINLTGPIELQVTSTADTSFLAEVRSMMEAAENGRGHYVRMADRAARMYAPFVHSLAAIAFVMWMLMTGGDWKTSIYISVALLIITCPCALGLAVPVVHVIGAAKLFERGILMKDGAALERLAEVDAVAFDKTGTITTGTPTVTSCGIRAAGEKAIASALAQTSAHPASTALKAWLGTQKSASADSIREHPGLGVEGVFSGKRARLGRASWVGELASGDTRASGTAFAIEGHPLRAIALTETLRPHAQSTIAALKENGIASTILSGDTVSSVATIAEVVGANAWHGECTPRGKIEHVNALQADGRKALMVGDGINDAPALAAGYVSMAPSSGSDVGRTAADFVFTRGNLDAVVEARDIALHARTLVRQNFALATVYNMIAVPIAMAGWVTPLVAAIAMSGSSIAVVLNSMRLNRDTRQTVLRHSNVEKNDHTLARSGVVAAE